LIDKRACEHAESADENITPKTSGCEECEKEGTDWGRYWLVVTDIRMPLIDGYQFIKKVKEVKPDVKVFFMSAFLTDDIQYRTGLSLVKVDEYIEKPISLNDFLRLVKKYLLATQTSKY
jgi:response regulator RpfG family c-di-GMP phosphodiesterase